MAIVNTNTAPILQEGTNITLTQTGQTITITATDTTNAPGGSNTQVQFNDSGVFGGDAGLTYNKTTNVVSLESVDFATTPVAADAERRLKWDNDEGSLVLTLKGGNVTIPIGAEVVSLVYNAEATTLAKGEVVYVFGAQGQRISVKRAVNTSDATSAQTLGVIAESIAAGAEGFCMVQGMIRGIDTSACVQGDTLYLSATAGQYTKTKPVAPNHLVYIGFAVKINASSGEIFVRPQNGYEMDEIHDYLEGSVQNNDVISYESSSGLYKPKSIPTLLGYTPANQATTITINGTSYDLSNNRTWSVGTVTSVAALTLGTTGTDVSSSVANGTTTPVITLNIPTASATNRGALSSTDWTTFNNKLSAAITSLNGLTASTQTFTNDTNVTITSATSTHTLGWSGQLSIARGGTGLSSLGTANQILRVNSGATALEYFTFTGATASGTTNEIAYFTGVSSLGSLSTTTYPSLTELSYVKGVTSSIQTQFASYLPLAGGTMTGQIVLKEGTDSSDYSKGLRFPNDPYGGSSDTSGLRLYRDGAGTEKQVLELYVTNDISGPVQDRINFSAANNSLVTINDNIIWHAGNLSNPVTGTGTSGYVAYFNGTSSITGESNLFWDAANDRLGIGINTPLVPLHVETTGTGTTMGSNVVATFRSQASGRTSTIQLSDNTTSNYISSLSGSFGFGSAATELMRLTSGGNLGLGVTPSAWSIVTPIIQIGSGGAFIGGQGSANIIRTGVNIYYDGSNWRYINAGYGSWSETSDGAFKWFSAISGSANAVASPSNLMTLNTSGNLGLGVTPSAWGSPFKALEGGDGDNQGYFAFQTNVNAIKTGVNNYFDGSNYVYKFSSSPASRYDINTDNFIWNLAGSGTAGQLITFTQAMTLNASGNLGLGVTPSSWGSGYTILEQSSLGGIFANGASPIFSLGANAYNNGTNWIYKNSSQASLYQTFNSQHLWLIAQSGTAGNAITFTQAMTLDSSGRLGIGTTSPSEVLDVYKANNTSWAPRIVCRDQSYASFLGVYNSKAGVFAHNSALNAWADLYINTVDGTAGISNNGAIYLPGTTITSGGNVGINTTSPSAKLVVEDGVANQTGAPTYRGSMIISNGGGATSSAGGLEFHAASSGSGYGWRVSTPDLGFGNVPVSYQSRTNTASWTERLRLNTSGQLQLNNYTSTSSFAGTVAGLLAFDSSGNILTKAVSGSDTYETGTWTPTYTMSGTGFTSITYDTGNRNGYYTKIGDIVFIIGEIRTDSITKGSASGDVRIGGLPFSRNAPSFVGFLIHYATTFASEVPRTGMGNETGTTFTLYRERPLQTSDDTALGIEDLGTGADSNWITFSGFYKV